MKKIAIFVSGSGSDMQSVIDSINRGEINGQISLVISSKEGVFAENRAKIENIPYFVYSKKNYESNDCMYEKIIEKLEEYGVELIVLAGYLSILSSAIVNKFRNKIINIHPSLIPSFCGKGYYGLKVHEEVIKYGVKITGATVHYVDEGADTGKIICQEAVEVSENDTAESLQKKVLEVEHRILPKVVKMLCE